MISWVVSGALALVGVRVVDPRNPLRVRAGLHVELLGVMNYSECKPLSRVPGCVCVGGVGCVCEVHQSTSRPAAKFRAPLPSPLHSAIIDFKKELVVPIAEYHAGKPKPLQSRL